MFVACPHCGFLVAAHGGTTLRCPRCGSPIDPKQAQPLPPAATAEPEAVAQADVAVETGTGTASEPAPEPAAVAVEKPRRKRGTHAPSFARLHAPAVVRATHWRSWLVVAGLALLLLVQVVLAQRDVLAADARWRPLVGSACTLLRCTIPAWREPAAFTMLQRSVQPKPGERGVLHVSASFRNDARWEQPWPTVMLTLSDMDGRQVGQRAFTPSDYLAQDRDGRIAPGQSATIQLDVVEPARQVVAFTFDFM
ncbi:DUF3426 domain-containing protein [Lysobacter solisilvae (ex Woo and Kim 2020)]|uniref:DUF3426 domain-containing protein n=1 Tax=Agrilutibacter terrestris TaxID=2865112 RepID=A0A7H0FZW4_9GAMM|nr:DUF3426 domain-containing protein [Lysobacter terrestris]QNP41580.1 DUF3426 domain-containing protein [Lysobacter terrestris]